MACAELSIGCVLIVGVLITIILVPLSIQRLDYYDYGLVKKAGGSVNTDKVYKSGRYLLGPLKSFLKYQADTHYESFTELSVFSSATNNQSVGLEFKVDVVYTYLLKFDDIGSLHRELASSYKGVIQSRTRDAIKNEAIHVKFNEYFEKRRDVELRFRNAVQRRWDENPSVHAILDQFLLGRIRISESVAEKQLEAAIQNERNDMETYLQLAEIERQQTAVEVNKIQLETDKVLRTAEAEASLLRSNAIANGTQIKATAEINGTTLLFETVGITNQEQRTAYTYVRNLKRRNQQVNVGVSYLSEDNVIKTTTV